MACSKAIRDFLTMVLNHEGAKPVLRYRRGREAELNYLLVLSALYRLSSSRKYFSLVKPITFILFLIMNTGTSLYFGITTGRMAPG